MNYKIVAIVFIILTIIGFSTFAYDQYYVIPSQQSQLATANQDLAAVAQKLDSITAELAQINSSLMSSQSGITSLNSSIITENSQLQSLANQLISAPRVGLISSEATVTKYYVPLMNEVTSINMSGYIFYLGTMNGTPVVVTESLPRQAGTAQTTTIMDTRFNIIANIFTGIAGSRNPNIYMGDVFVAAFTVDKSAFHYHRDYISPYDIPIEFASNGSFISTYTFPSSYGLVQLAATYNGLGTTNISMITGNSTLTGAIQAKMVVGVDGSANLWTNNLGWLKFENALYQTDAGEDNAYGFSSVNLAYGVPCLVLQGISNSKFYPSPYNGGIAEQRVAEVAVYVIDNFNQINMAQLNSPAAFSQLSAISNAYTYGYIVANKIFTSNPSSSINVTEIVYTAQNGSTITVTNMGAMNNEYTYPTVAP